MKRMQNRKETVRRERLVMVLSSVFVLGAMVCVGVYMKGQNTQEKEQGYHVDFAELGDSASEKYAELSENVRENEYNLQNVDDALDYMPREEILEEGIYTEEAGSGQVKIGKLKENIEKLSSDIDRSQTIPRDSTISENVNVDGNALEQEQMNGVLASPPAFLEASGFYMPVEGRVLMHYDMDRTVYFATLDQYKYNPATIISAPESAPVYACADATVVCIYSNEEIGNAMCLDLGNGYEVTYGQLKDIAYGEGAQIQRGTQIAAVAAPTKYYSAEGSNLYFAMKKDGSSQNAETLLPLE